MAGKYKIKLLLIHLYELFLFKANDTLDLSLITIDDLKKAIDVPKELRNNQAAMIMYQMDEIRKLVSREMFKCTFALC